MSSADLEKPIVALTISFAGKREIPRGRRTELDAALRMVLRRLEAGLDQARIGAAAGGRLSQRFRGEAGARLTLVTGLADGADQLAADLFLADRHHAPGVTRSLGAVLPAAREAYVENSPVGERNTFQRLAQACDFVLELDGTLPAAPDSVGAEVHRRAARARASAFQAQSELLLRLGDLLIAVDDAGGHSLVGGTRQTVRAAVDFGLPVILVRLGEPGLAVLRTRLDLDEPPQMEGEAAAAAVDALAGELLGLGDPTEDPYVELLMAEFYGEDAASGSLRADRLLPAVWSAFERRLARRRPPPASSAGAAPYMAYRRRASELSRRYAGLYRGSFLVGYLLAVAAVTLAALSLLTLVFSSAGGLPESAALGVLGALGLLKLLAVSGMALLARQAHERRLSHRAADYRYLSERLRTMTFLPYAGSLRPPPHLSQPYTTRVLAQGAIDQLFYSIVRQADPAAALGAAGQRDVSLAPRDAMSIIRREWLNAQRRYHQENTAALGRMTERFELWSRRLNGLIVGIVLVDLLLVGLDLVGAAPPPLAELLRGGVEPTLIGLAAVLPAAVASLNGVRFQSEVARLADRSEQMSFELSALETRAEGLAQRGPSASDVLHVAEDTARLTLDEVSEWTAIYGKEFVEM